MNNEFGSRLNGNPTTTINTIILQCVSLNSIYSLCSNQYTAEYKQCSGPFVEEFKSPIVYRDGIDLQEAAGNLSDCSHKFCHGRLRSQTFNGLFLQQFPFSFPHRFQVIDVSNFPSAGFLSTCLGAKIMFICEHQTRSNVR